MRKYITILCMLALSFCLGDSAKAADTPFLTKGQNLKVMPVGDSITLGKGDNLGGYRRILYEWLTANGYAITYVGKQNLPMNKRYPSLAPADGSTLWHEGYGSMRTDQILNGGTAEKQTVPPIATSMQNFKPDVVLLMIGTNDILQNYQLDTLEARLGQIIDAIYAYNPKTDVLVAGIAPIQPPRPADKEQRVLAYNTAIQGIVAKQQALGHPIAFVNVHDALKGGMSGDGVHPTSKGYAQMAQAWYKALTGQDAPAIDPKNPLLLPPPLPQPPKPTVALPAPSVQVSTNNSVPNNVPPGSLAPTAAPSAASSPAATTNSAPAPASP